MLNKLALKHSFRAYLLIFCAVIISVTATAEDTEVTQQPVEAAMIVTAAVPPDVAAKAYVLQDFATGQILLSHKPDEQMPPASLTKLMTAYVVSKALEMEEIALTDKVLISEKAWRMVGSRSFIEVNTQVPVEALLRGMIIQSGNDAAVALAEHVAGSEESFAERMNTAAIELGMTSTQYRNATGLPDPEHYTTAADISLLSMHIIADFPEHYAWYAEKEYTYNKITQHNRNKLLWRDGSVDGLKTGHTQAAGYCLAASAKRGSMRLITVVLGTRSEEARAQESQKLLNYGFRFFEAHQLSKAREKLVTARVWKGKEKDLAAGLIEGLVVTVPRGQYKNLTVTTHLDTPIEAPVLSGAAVGTVVVKLGDQIVSKQPLVALVTVDAGNWWRRMWDQLWMWFFG